MSRRAATLGEEVRDDPGRFGGKAAKLATLAAGGTLVPAGVAVGTDAYDEYVDSTGLRGRIVLELARKDLAGMRYEELWDLSQTIRGMFASTPLPGELEKGLAEAVEPHLGDLPVAVRSSAIGEDSATASFAGVHESYVNVRGTRQVLDRMRSVWASLWSEAALMYRKELGLDVQGSTMAVLVQELVDGERSGIAFTQSPVEPSQGVIEAVHGLNSGLVDGLVEPDRWTLARRDGTVVSHRPATRGRAVRTTSDGTELQDLPPELAAIPPLTEMEVPLVWDLAMRAENLLGAPQDVEWTLRGDELFALQSRPITTLDKGGADDRRVWYMGMRRGLESLEELRGRLEEEVFPEMERVARLMGELDLTALQNAELADAIEKRASTYRRWVDVYWEDFIPLAHGARLFGEFYNLQMAPEDPHEFVLLLEGQELLSTRRNAGLVALAMRLRGDETMRGASEAGDLSSIETALGTDLEELLTELGGSFGAGRTARRGMVRLIAQMALHLPQGVSRDGVDTQALEDRFLSSFEGGGREQAERMLDLGRASYRLRDDDNILLGRIEAQLVRAVEEGLDRLESRLGARPEGLENLEVAFALRELGWRPDAEERLELPAIPRRFGARQLVGSPSSRGVARGRARVILEEGDLFDFRSGEVLVTDAIDPNMTFVVPLASAVVERRGGMLIHGAIIAREYGLPCVTGVANATEYIHTGDEVTVDGYLGIVSVQKRGA